MEGGVGWGDVSWEAGPLWAGEGLEAAQLSLCPERQGRVKWGARGVVGFVPALRVSPASTFLFRSHPLISVDSAHGGQHCQCAFLLSTFKFDYK